MTDGMKLTMMKNRGPSITVIGCISEERGLVHASVFAESNNADHFENFLIDLKKKCEGRRVVIILDNLRVHHSKKLASLFDDAFQQMFLPTYSSELNPIERLWSLLKRKWAQNLLQYTDELAGLRGMRSQDTITRATIMKLRETLGKISFEIKVLFRFNKLRHDHQLGALAPPGDEQGAERGAGLNHRFLDAGRLWGLIEVSRAPFSGEMKVDAMFWRLSITSSNIFPFGDFSFRGVP